MLALRAPRSSFICAMLMCSRLNLCKSSVGTFTGTESISKNASTPPTWRAGFRKQDPAILTPSSRRVALSIYSLFLHDDGGEKIIKLCSYLCKAEMFFIEKDAVQKVQVYSKADLMMHKCLFLNAARVLFTRWAGSTWWLLTWACVCVQDKKVTQTVARVCPPPPPPPPHPALHVTSDHINAAVTHFQQPLPTWQSSSPSFSFFIFCDTRLDTQSFSRPELLVTCVLLVLGGGRGSVF